MTILDGSTVGGPGSGATRSDETLSGEARQRVDAYLEKLREGLLGLSSEDMCEIIEELRGHILEKAVSEGDGSVTAVDRALARLGTPDELAAQYMTDDLLERAARNWFPVFLFRGLVRWASLSIAGVWVLLGCVVGYVLGVSFILSAILKPMHPQTAGLWVLPGDPHNYSLRLGFGPVPVGGREVLGWWMVPLGLLVGGGLCLFTTEVGLWCARQFRKAG
ncbi:MAG: hypothetical protein ABSG70_07680 [Terriglobales bacterium]|jgi:hypothetical protein